MHYRVGLVFPDGSEQCFDFDTAAGSLHLVDASCETPEPDLVHRIAASALAGWAEHRRSFFSVRASSRRFGTVYRLRRHDRMVLLERRNLPDLLMYYLTYIAAGSEIAARREVDLQIAALPNRSQPSIATNPATSGGDHA